MERKTIFAQTEYQDIRNRLENLQPDALRQWGQMNVAQMLAHACVPLEVGLGKLNLPPEGNFVMRWLIKKIVLSKTSFTPNLPTAKGFLVPSEQDFELQKSRLIQDLDDAYTLGLNGNWAPHNSFGPLEPEKWGQLTYMHLDHHLRQFGA